MNEEEPGMKESWPNRDTNRILIGETEGGQEKPQSGSPVPWPKFETSALRMQVETVKAVKYCT
jgi:hypothetical protein